jgi:hypothetical protein
MAAHSLDLIFPNHRASEFSIVSEQLMGFSGAKIQEISIKKWEKLEDGCDSDRKDNISSLPELLFVKHIVFSELPPSATEVSRQKDIRNRHSYINETNFIENLIPQLERTGDFYFPQTHKILHQTTTGEEGKGATETFTFFTDSLTPLAEQFHVFDTPQLLAVLAWTARLHAVYHGAVDQPEEEEEEGGGGHVAVLDRHDGLGLWRQGTHLAWEKRPAAETQQLASHWRGLCAAFCWEDLAAAGERLAAVAPYVARQLSVANRRNLGRTTVVHGDVRDELQWPATLLCLAFVVCLCVLLISSFFLSYLTCSDLLCSALTRPAWSPCMCR